MSMTSTIPPQLCQTHYVGNNKTLMIVENTRISRSALERLKPDGGGGRFDFDGVAGELNSPEVEAGKTIFGKGLSFWELVLR